MTTLEQILVLAALAVVLGMFGMLVASIRWNRQQDGLGNLVAKLATLEGENKRLRASSNETHMISMDHQRQVLRLRRDYRFSQTANERHKRANRRLRELPEVEPLRQAYRLAQAKATAEKRAAYEAKEAYADEHRVVQGKTRAERMATSILGTIPNPRREDAEEATKAQMSRAGL